MSRFHVLLAALVAAGVLCGEAAALGPVQIPGLQVALYRHGHYKGPIDGIAGPLTKRALVDFQRSAGIEPDGRCGDRTLAAFGRLGRPLFGARMLRRGMVGFDVSVLQFLLAKRGFPTRALNSNFGPVTEERVRAFQRKAGLVSDGIVGRQTRAALLGRLPHQRRHVVRPGETLTTIADRTGTTVQELARRNRLDLGRPLLIGTTLLIPDRRPARKRS
jgi:peptidoglycan hydrolase-like protein with peptidoglycan-binding domain